MICFLREKEKWSEEESEVKGLKEKRRKGGGGREWLITTACVVVER